MIREVVSRRGLFVSGLSGKTVFVVEDDVILAADLIHALEEVGADVVGPARTLEFAQFALDRQTADAVVLDVELLDGTVFDIANDLHARGIPILFYTSQPDKCVEVLRGTPVVGKDRTPREAVRVLSAMFETEAAE